MPELTAAAEAEQNEKARESVKFELKLLRDGYILTETDDDRYTLTVASRSGVTSRFVDRADLEGRGIEAVVRELAKH